ncbi:MAG: methionine--tRNA ligase [Betaproteobacteria bacterium]|nr:methionine--tRNA ligase [Betaproteobacteria bacterium]
MTSAARRILVTTALPYANGAIHIGHMLEHIQASIWVRYLRMAGHETYHVCADDAHGTPVMLKAEADRTTPEELIGKMQRAHQADFAGFGVDYDCYHSTHSEENRQLAELIYTRLDAAGLIVKRKVVQMFDAKRNMFLPDRYVKGDCPRCQAPDQYGDSCEKCGAAYTPAELGNPVSVLSGEKPELRESEHLFFTLSARRDFLREWVADASPGPGPGPRLQPAAVNKLAEWLDGELRDWDISRDAPYFGFKIPGFADKYFYVWLDAPIGYLASFRKMCSERKVDFDQFLAPDSSTEMYHFIGKDILYFHGLFWPAMLEGAGMRTPTRLFAHGFLSVNGAKMSKSKGTFITASSYLKLGLDPEWLRYYFASKLSDRIEDIDLNMEDFVNRVNADLVGKLANIPSRMANFLHKRFAGKLSAAAALIKVDADRIGMLYERRRYADAVREIMVHAEEVNRAFEVGRPWDLAKNGESAGQLHDLCSAAIQSFRILAGLLKPVLPRLAADAERFLNIDPLNWDDLARPLAAGHQIGKFAHLMRRIEPRQIDALIAANREQQQPEDGDTATIGIDQFAAVDLRVAKIISAEEVTASDKLIKVTVDLGELGQRTIFAGLRGKVDVATLAGQSAVVCANLKPRKMRFGTSEGMLLAAPGSEGGLVLLQPAGSTKPGAKIS